VSATSPILPVWPPMGGVVGRLRLVVVLSRHVMDRAPGVVRCREPRTPWPPTKTSAKEGTVDAADEDVGVVLAVTPAFLEMAKVESWGREGEKEVINLRQCTEGE